MHDAIIHAIAKAGHDPRNGGSGDDFL
jgi:hypothetical protein